VNEETGLPSWEIRNSNGQIIAEDKGDGNGPHFYKTDKDGNLIGIDGKTIAGDDKEYESKRNELTNIDDLERQINIIGTLAVGNNVTGTATVNGELTDLVIGMKLAGDKWVGFSIDIYGGVKGFLNDELTTEFNKNPELFDRLVTGSFVVMELKEAKTEFDFPDNPLKYGEATMYWDIYQYHRDKNGIYILDYLTVRDYETKIQEKNWPIFAHGRPIKKPKKSQNIHEEVIP